MKVCPTCQKVYEDDSMVFCLDDGTRLQAGQSDPNATWHLPQADIPPTVRSARPTAAPVQPTITARPEQFRSAGPYDKTGDSGKSIRKNPLPWIFAIVVVLAISGVLMAWLLTRDRRNELANYQTPTSTPIPTPSVDVMPTATPEIKHSPTPGERESPTPKSTPTASPKPVFSILNNTSFNGSRITYYPRASVAQCQADCAGNSNCKGFTWVRPGAYKAGDSAMCYLMSAVTAKVPHACCVSGMRN